MTVNQLWKKLGRLVAQGHGRKKVCVNKRTFSSNLEDDGGTILDVHSCRLETINVLGDDGGVKERKDGRECCTTVAVLYGSDGERQLPGDSP